MTDKLKPCPFCGREAILVKNEHPRLHRPSRNGQYHVACYECDLMMGYDEDYGGQFDTKEEAIEAWNRRYTVADQARDIMQKYGDSDA